MDVSSWRGPAVEFVAVTLALCVVGFPGVSVAYALATGGPPGAGFPAVLTAALALAGGYALVAGDRSSAPLWRFVAAFVAAAAAASLAGLAALSRFDLALPGPVLARAVVLAVSYPVAAVAAARAPG